MTRDVPKNLGDPGLYLNRELAQLEFNFRVLAQAQDARVPLLERLRYLCISCTNLDEFFEVRVAILRQQSQSRRTASPAPTACRRARCWRASASARWPWSKAQYEFWNEALLPELAREGIRFPQRDRWTVKQQRWLQGYFQQRDPAGAVAARPRSGASVSAHPQQEPEHRGRAGRQGRVRPRRPHGAGARTALAAAHHPPAGRSGRPAHDFVFLSSVLQRVRRRAVPGHAGQGRVPVPRHAQQRTVRRRGRGREPRARAARRAARAAVTPSRCGWRSRRPARKRSPIC